MCVFATMCAVLLLCCANAFAAPPIAGVVSRVIDGDSIVVDAHEIRLHGIDAPEYAQTCNNDGREWPCGAVAKKKLEELVAGQELRCSVIGRDRYKRYLAECFFVAAGGSVNVNKTMVATGWAFVYRTPSGKVNDTNYLAEESAARMTGAGMFDSEVQPPSDYRRGVKR